MKRAILGVAIVLTWLGAPGYRVAAQAGTQTIPSCTTLSTPAISSLLQIGPLILDKTVGPLCMFSYYRTNRYIAEIDISIVPYIASLFDRLQGDAMRNHGGQVNSKLFFTNKQVTSVGMSPCQPEQKVVDQLGPKCAGQPTQDLFTVVGYDAYKRTGPKIMVTAATSAQQGDVYLGHVIELVQEILSGKIGPTPK